MRLGAWSILSVLKGAIVAIENMEEDDDAHDAVFAAVGSEGDALGLFDE